MSLTKTNIGPRMLMGSIITQLKENMSNIQKCPPITIVTGGLLKNLSKGDFYELVKKDLNILGENVTEDYIKMLRYLQLIPQ